YDAAHPYWREEGEEARAQIKKRELAEAEKKRQQARAAREAEKQQAVSTDWYAAVDTRVRAHFKDWAWAALDDRIQQHLDRHGDIFKDAVGAALGTIRKQVCDQFKCADEQLQRALEARLAEQQERHDGRIEAALARERAVIGEAQTQLREEVK